MTDILEAMEEETSDTLSSIFRSTAQLDLSKGDRMYNMASKAMCSPYMQMVTERLGLTYAALRNEDLEKWCESCPHHLHIPNLRLALQKGLLPCTIHYPWCNASTLKWALEKAEFTFSMRFMEHCLEMRWHQAAYTLAFENLHKLVGVEQKDARAVGGMMESYMQGQYFLRHVEYMNETARLQASYLGTEVELFDVNWVFSVHRKYRILKRMYQVRGVAKAIAPLRRLRLRAAGRVYAPGGMGYDLAKAEFNASGTQSATNFKKRKCE